MKLVKEKLHETYSIKDKTKNYKGSWFRDIPKNPETLFKFYLGVENIKTGKRRIKAARFYFGNNYPYVELRSLEFNEKGLLARVAEIRDAKGNNKKLAHLMTDLEIIEKKILIPNRKFPN